MAAFDRILSGIPEMDKALDNIRLGDNVVFRVSELSYGSHIFQDLVEADILYTAVFANEKTLAFAPDKLSAYKDISSDFISDEKNKDIARVYDLKGSELTLYYDLENNKLLLV
ncbi:hypothetical protein [Butyrivibrio sp. WCD2001]|uniref:hypothetical protein n=1 Tax=Butyrivibrio sp. WCD2001 TaxID=1280681 RepID=UPI0003F6E9E2|nr:hypothetical protein [Butyrivibrio sp. WCD2001]